MLRRTFRRWPLVLVGSAACVVALGQSFSVDMDIGFGDSGVGNGAPSSAFGGAAGTPGVWNRIDAGGQDPTYLLGLDGIRSHVLLTLSGGFGSGYGYHNGLDSGDYALLMNDASRVGDEVEFTLSGLRAGRYLVYTYAVDPSGVQNASAVTVPGADNPVQACTGPIPGNQFIQGITHTVHSIDLSSDTLTIQVSGPWPHTYCNGFQVVAVPEPSPLLPLATFGLGLIFLRRQKA